MISATEELRRLLDERGVEHYDGTESTLWLKDEHGYRASADELTSGRLSVHVWCDTPEQAIAATLVSGTSSSESANPQVRCTNSKRNAPGQSREDSHTLLPCPFCGGEAETHEVTFPYHYWDVLCDGECFDHFCEMPTEAKAIAVWNSRAERTCRIIGTIYYDGEGVWYHELSCGHEAETVVKAPPRYCPECGARVER